VASRVIGVATVQVKADTTGFRGALNGLGSNLSKSFSGIRRAIGALGLGHIAREVIDFGATYRVQLDNARAAVTGLTHSQQEADKLMREMTQFAINTPFDLPGVQDATTRLLAFGAGFGVTTDNVIDYIAILGDAAASTGKGADAMNNVITTLGKISGQGRVLRRDMNQLTANFPSLHPWQILADATGESVENLQRMSLKPGGLESIISGDEAVRLFIAGMKEMPGAAGAMDRRMQTLGGTFEMFKDTMGVAVADGLVPFFRTLQGIMGSSRIQIELKSLVAAFSTLAAGIMKELGPVLPELIHSFKLVVIALMPIIPAIGDLAAMFAMALVSAAPLIAVIAQVASAVTNFLMKMNPDYLGILSAALLVFWMSLSGGPVVALIIAGIVALAMIIIHNWDTIVAATGAMVAAVVGWWDWLFENVIDPVRDFIMDVVHIWQMLYDWLVGNSIIPDLVKAIVKWFTILFDFVGTIFNAIKAVILAIWNGIKTAVVTVVTAVVDFIRRHWQLLVAIIAGPLGLIVALVISNWDRIKSFISTTINTIKSVVTTVWNAIKTAVITPIQAARDAAKAAVQAILDKVRSAWSGLSSFVSGVWNGIKSAITGPIQAAYDFVASKVAAIKRLVQGAIDKVKSIPGAGLIGRGISAIGGIFGASGGVFNQPTMKIIGEAGPEALVPMNNPMRAMAVMQQAGLDRLAASMGGQRGFSGPLVQMNGTTIQDATDADLVAQRTLVAMQAAMVVT
jgi:tape measure domain-containing protein